MRVRGGFAPGPSPPGSQGAKALKPPQIFLFAGQLTARGELLVVVPAVHQALVSFFERCGLHSLTYANVDQVIELINGLRQGMPTPAQPQ